MTRKAKTKGTATDAPVPRTLTVLLGFQVELPAGENADDVHRALLKALQELTDARVEPKIVAPALALTVNFAGAKVSGTVFALEWDGDDDVGGVDRLPSLPSVERRARAGVPRGKGVVSGSPENDESSDDDAWPTGRDHD